MSTSAPIAIVGLGCRLPGADGPEAFWTLLREGRDATREVPPERWNAEAFYDPDPAKPGKTVTRRGGFLDAVDGFDERFFGVAPDEAARMDPQHRMLLEVAWEALEHAGIAPDSLAGSATGVFVGVASNDYERLVLSDRSAVDGWAATGSSYSMAANRLSYFLDLQGPSFAVDAACASSLVAVHLARRSLAAGECDLALAGGVNVLLAPEWSIAFSQARMLSRDGRCKSFDAEADGYGRGEGCGVVVLKRLDDAVRDGDPVLAVVRGSAVNQDGLTNGVTAPSAKSQTAVIKSALADAGIEPGRLGYVEAHATGTPLGDPIEVHALAAALANGGERAAPCAVGSVKTNIGHLEGAAGVAGLIKTTLALWREAIPPHLNLRALNPRIDLSQAPLEIATELRPWPRGEGARYAGVSSFGFGGTNAHVVLEEAPPPSPVRAAAEGERALCISARDEEGLDELAQRWAGWLRHHPEASLDDACLTAGAGRAAFEHRLAATGDSPAALAAALGDAPRGRVDARTARDAATVRAADLDAASLAARFVAGARVDWSGAPGRRRAGLPTYPFRHRRHWVAAAPLAASAPAPAAAAVPDAELPEVVLDAIAAVSGRAREDIRPEHELGADLGFDSLQTIALDRRLRQLLPGLEDGEQPFDEETSVASLIALLEAARVRVAPGPAEIPTAAKRWATYAELIGMDPGETYVGGAFRAETHRLHTLRAEGAGITGLLDVENKYAGTANFHLTQMGAYAFVVQMIQGYVCYKHGVGKDRLGMPTLDAIDMRWERMVRTSKDIPGRVAETRAREEGGRWVLELDFDVGDGAVTGRLVGRIRIDAPERPLAERAAREYGEFAELLGKDPAETYTGGTFQGEQQTIHDVEAAGPTIRALLDVENEFSGTPHFHLTQMGTYSAVVQLLLGYLCYRFDVPKERLGMPVLKSFEILWKRMITQPTGIALRVTEESCEPENERYLMRMSFDVGDGSAVGTLVGLIPKP